MSQETLLPGISQQREDIQMKHQCDMEEKLEGNLNFYCCFQKTKRNYILNSEQNVFKSPYQESLSVSLKTWQGSCSQSPFSFQPRFSP